MEWEPICTAPFGVDIELAVLFNGEAHALVFPCRRIIDGWANAETAEKLAVRPTHWRIWRRVS